MQVKSIAECSPCKGEHSAILLTFIKLPFVIKIFVLSILSVCLRQVLLYFHGNLTETEMKILFLSSVDITNIVNRKWAQT